MLDTVFLVAAVIGGTVMICQFLLSLLGMGDDSAEFGDLDASDLPDANLHHTDSSGLFGVLSFRTLIAAAAFFGVSGKAATSAGLSQPVSLTIAILVGLAAMYGMYWLMLGMSKLTSTGNERIGLAIGKHATVYVTIPAIGTGVGKVQMTLQNRTVELLAVSTEDEPLRPGETVEVVNVTNSDTVEVRRVRETVDA
jgi:hypothetical protein